MYQKTYTTDSLPLKRYLNTGQRSKYYAKETHEGIISKTDYEKVQNLLAKKSITGEIDADAIIDKILRRAELQFNYCAAGDDDPTTMQIKRACKEFKPTDTFPESFYSSIVSKIILHLDTHIDIKLRNGQTL